MKRVFAAVAILILAGCGDDQKAPGQKGMGGPLTSDDQSPIIIADGSVLVKRPKKTGTGYGGIGQPTGNHAKAHHGTPQATDLAFLCGDTDPCVKPCDSATKSACHLADLTGKAWTLSVTDSSNNVVAILSDDGTDVDIMYDSSNLKADGTLSVTNSSSHPSTVVYTILGSPQPMPVKCDSNINKNCVKVFFK